MTYDLTYDDPVCPCCGGVRGGHKDGCKDQRIKALEAELDDLRKRRDELQAEGTRLVERNRALNADVDMLRAHGATIHRDWSSLHELSMGAVRQALSMPDATVPELVREITRLSGRSMIAEESSRMHSIAVSALQDADAVSQELACMFEWLRAGVIKFLDQGVEPKRPGQAYEDWSELDELARMVGREG